MQEDQPAYIHVIRYGVREIMAYVAFHCSNRLEATEEEQQLDGSKSHYYRVEAK